ncbi:hypothetical protein Tco_1054943 [Tanacetum coccineum]|uniref:Pre-mRNA splicing Prp18-interacting factor n=1 Tax=Tanacetum coccineum TaxID=301880 RepID=A0ABQ5GY83_9ASTR
MTSYYQPSCYGCGGPLDGLLCRRCTCEWCGNNLRDGFCAFCNSRDGNSFIYDSNPNSFDNPPDFSYQPPQPQYQSYSCELCGNDSHYGYDCSPRFPLVYEQEPCYNQNYSENYYPQNSPSFPQQSLCCTRCGGPHETLQCDQLIFDEPYCANCGGPHMSFQCQPINQNYFEPNYSGFDQPPQYSIDHQEDLNQPRKSDVHDSLDKLVESRNELLNMVRSFCEMVIQQRQAANIEQSPPQEISHETYIPEPSQQFNSLCDDDDDDEENTIPLSMMPQILQFIAYSHKENSQISPPIDLPTVEPVHSLSMGDEHLDTIPETESDELIKSSVENLVPIPSESKDISDGECELPLCDDSSETQFTTFSNPLFDSNDDFSSSDDESFSEEDVPMEEFKIYSNPLFDLDEEIISSEENSISIEVLDEINSIPPGMNDCFNAESDLIESLLNRDTSIDSFHKIDSLLDEFAGKLTLLKPISPEIDDSDFDPEGEIRLLERLLYYNSSPRPSEYLSIESFSPSPIPVEDSDSFMEEINIFLALDDSTPPGVESDYDSEGDILFLEELLNDDLELNEDECFDPGGGEIDEDDDYFPFTFVIRVFYHISPTLRILLCFSPAGMKTLFLTPTSPLIVSIH